MIKLENQTIFKCSYCSRISKSAAGIYVHEIHCKKNPHNQLLCASCAHCRMEERLSNEGEKCRTCGWGESIYGSCYGCDGRIKITDFICDIDGSKMYSPKIKLKASAKEVIARCDKPMVDATQTCEYYKNVYDEETTD